ncbi:glycosyltransferase family 2 protein [Maricaulis sp.]|uniref:glycosyltransferase family 2 protein n=1 Tax=Maricaulis sp. TaxID=1486257 RepID=UPI001B2E94CD|nr:glycosyltransferase family 2 protein [Maricaulis sp.]MBO6797760.1 glycosyltransferase family 2 protein [Maricaulis sp.]
MPHTATACEYSVIVPVYNSGEALLDLVQRLSAVFETTLQTSYEIIIVDDGSTDPCTRSSLLTVCQHDAVRALVLTRNFGKPGAILCGLQEARGRFAITIDDDLQQRPEDIPALVEHNAHAVVVATHINKQHTPAQRAASRIKRGFDRLILGHKVPMAPMKLISRHVVDGMLSMQGNRPFIPALIREVTTDIVGVPVSHDASSVGKSRYTWRTRWKQFSNLLFGNSALLMQVIAWMGLVVMALSLILAGVVLVRKILGITTETGWSSLMVSILLIGGLNLGATGIAGQYFIRILDAVSAKPAYLVREQLGTKEPDADG